MLNALSQARSCGRNSCEDQWIDLLGASWSGFASEGALQVPLNLLKKSIGSGKTMVEERSLAMFCKPVR
jgi:hypothetical protein